MPRVVLMVGVVIASLLGGVSPVDASEPATATGTLAIVTDVFTLIFKADGKAVYAENDTSVYYGDLTGSTKDSDRYTLVEDGSFAGRNGRELCTSCTLDGRTGDYTAVFTYAGHFTNRAQTAYVYSGHLTVTGATGGLAGLHLHGAFHGTQLSTEYSYTYSFS